jgi:hypothetical protein
MAVFLFKGYGVWETAVPTSPTNACSIPRFFAHTAIYPAKNQGQEHSETAGQAGFDSPAKLDIFAAFGRIPAVLYGPCPFAGIAQLVEHCTENAGVPSSSLGPGTVNLLF